MFIQHFQLESLYRPQRIYLLEEMASCFGMFDDKTLQQADLLPDFSRQYPGEIAFTQGSRDQVQGAVERGIWRHVLQISAARAARSG